MVEINLFRHAPNAIELQSGDLLFREGDPGDVMFSVLEGNVELSRGGAVVEDVGPGGILGEMALIDAAPRSATAAARTAARVVPVDQRQFKYLVQEHPTFALKVMTVMAERLRRANLEITDGNRP
jgi:CRP/FNR family cyclic AMP-dependent transcriptional regulator